MKAYLQTRCDLQRVSTTHRSSAATKWHTFRSQTKTVPPPNPKVKCMDWIGRDSIAPVYPRRKHILSATTPRRKRHVHSKRTAQNSAENQPVG